MLKFNLWYDSLPETQRFLLMLLFASPAIILFAINGVVCSLLGFAYLVFLLELRMSYFQKKPIKKALAK